MQSGTLHPDHPLPLAVLHEPWEAAVGLAHRLAARNAMPVAALLPWENEPRDLWLGRLAVMARKPVEDLRQASPPDSERLVLNGMELGRRRGSRTPLGRFCPHCLDEDMAKRPGERDLRPWLRGWWLSADLEACHVHSVRLASDGQENPWHDADWDVMAMVPTLAMDDVSGERWLLGRLGAEPGHVASFLDRFPPIFAFDTLSSLGRLMSSCRVPGADLRASHLTVGFKALSQGEGSFMPVIEQLIVSARNASGSKGGRSFFWNFLRSQQDDRPADPLREWIRDVVTDMVNKNRFLRVGLVLDRPSPPCDLMRFDEVIARYGLSRPHAERTFAALGVKRLSSAMQALKAPVDDALLDENEVVRLVDMTDELTGIGVRQVIGDWVNARTFDQMAEWLPGLIAVDGLEGPVFSRAAVAGWIKDTLDAIPLLEEAPEGAATIGTLWHAGRKTDRDFGSGGIDRALRFIHDGLVQPLGCLGHELSSLVVPVDRRLWSRKVTRSPWMRFKEAAATLRCPEEELGHLVAGGHLFPFDAPTLDGRIVLDRAGVEAFAKTHVRSKHAGTGTSAPLMADGRPTFFYRRSDLATGLRQKPGARIRQTRLGPIDL
jgi:hypothetical protein